MTVDLETLEVTVGDDTLGPVLRACTQGHLALARGQLDGVVREAEDALAGKRRNPFAAAAGALALFRLRALDRLHDWTGNLHRWFPGFSDGAILHATFLLRSRPDGFRGAAVEALSSAEAPPLFTGCVRLWIDACRQLEGTVPAKVRALGERCRASALFTTVDDLRDP